MFNNFFETIKKHKLVLSGERVLVAVSGGPDSVALLHCLWRIQEAFDIKLHIAHLNHMLRQEADRDASFVTNLAKKLELPVTIHVENIPLLVEKGGSVETIAREVRYRFLQYTAEQYKCHKIALGHHADDQVETILANFIHGSGLRGLGGMLPVNGNLIRPMLYITRNEVKNYLKEQHLSWCEDNTNYETVYQRNRLRLKLLPVLEQYNPRIRSGLLQMSDILRTEEEYLEKRTFELFEGICGTYQGKLSMNLNDLKGVDTAFQRRLIRLAYGKMGKGMRELSFQHVEMVREILGQGQGKLTLPMKVEVYIENGLLLFRDSGRSIKLQKPSFSVRLDVPGAANLPLGVISAQVSTIPENLHSIPQNEAFLDLDKLRTPLEVRSRRPGDIFCPLGLGGKKKLKDFFVDARIPKEKKEFIPVVLSAGNIIWVAGLRIDERFKVTVETGKTLHLKYFEHGSN